MLVLRSWDCNVPPPFHIFFFFFQQSRRTPGFGLITCRVLELGVLLALFNCNDELITRVRVNKTKSNKSAIMNSWWYKLEFLFSPKLYMLMYQLILLLYSLPNLLNTHIDRLLISYNNAHLFVPKMNQVLLLKFICGNKIPSKFKLNAIDWICVLLHSTEAKVRNYLT